MARPTGRAICVTMQSMNKPIAKSFHCPASMLKKGDTYRLPSGADTFNIMEHPAVDGSHIVFKATWNDNYPTTVKLDKGSIVFLLEV